MFGISRAGRADVGGAVRWEGDVVGDVRACRSGARRRVQTRQDVPCSAPAYPARRDEATSPRCRAVEHTSSFPDLGFALQLARAAHGNQSSPPPVRAYAAAAAPSRRQFLSTAATPHQRRLPDGGGFGDATARPPGRGKVPSPRRHSWWRARADLVLLGQRSHFIDHQFFAL